jgi:hypothetical protein
MINSNVIRFKCELVEDNSATEKNLLNISNLNGCHLKGFATRIEKLDKPTNFMKHLETFKLIAWDGDNLDLNSMTKFIPIICINNLSGNLNDIPKLWTIRYECEIDELLKSWNNKICLMDNNNDIIISNNIDNIDSDNIHEVIIYYSIMNEEIPEEKYLHCAIKLHLKTKCHVCVIIGGGNGLKQEHIVTKNHNKLVLNNINNEIEIDYGSINYDFSKDPLVSLGLIKWFCYPLSRKKICGMEIENCFFHDYEDTDKFKIIK